MLGDIYSVASSDMQNVAVSQARDIHFVARGFAILINNYLGATYTPSGESQLRNDRPRAATHGPQTI
jgi:hypothetical protein